MVSSDKKVTGYNLFLEIGKNMGMCILTNGKVFFQEQLNMTLQVILISYFEVKHLEPCNV